MTRRAALSSLAFPPALLRADTAAAYIGVSVSHLRQLVSEGSAPPPRRISAAVEGWLRADLDAWAASLPTDAERKAAGESARCDEVFGP